MGQYFPGVEPVSGRDPRDRAALEAAVQSPYATAFGVDLFPSAQAKATRLFYGIAANHPFSNGNKRTALIAADLFCYANEFYLDMSRRTAVWAARLAASHNARGIGYEEALRRLRRVFARDMIPFAEVKAGDPRLYADCRTIMHGVRREQRRPGTRRP